MQDKYDIIGHLPADAQNETTKNLSLKDIARIASSSTHHMNLFKPINDIHKFLYHLTRNNHVAVTAMLAEDMSLFYRKGRVTDYSGRSFENISGFEYALWALDKHMWTTILECLPKNQQGTAILKLLKGQYDQVNAKGVTYSLNDKLNNETHFDFENTIIKELKTQVISIDMPGANWVAIEKQWIEGVGGAQKILPGHAVDEYCSNEPFYPVPQFISRPQTDKRFHNAVTDKNEKWFSADSMLSIEFAIYKGRRPRCAVLEASGVGRVAERDLPAMEALSTIRKNDFIILKSQLEQLVMVDAPQPIVPK